MNKAMLPLAGLAVTVIGLFASSPGGGPSLPWLPSPAASCNHPIRVQHATTNASLSKVGAYVCTNTCPPIFYTYEGEFWHKEITCDDNTFGARYEEPGVVADKWLDYTGQIREGCSSAPWITNTPAYYYVYDNYYEPACPAYAISDDPWVPSDACYNYVTYNKLGLPGWDWGEFTQTGDCVSAFLGETATLNDPQGCTGSWESGTGWGDPFTTAELLQAVGSRVIARCSALTTNHFAYGDAEASRTLDGNESCAEATQAKYRFEIQDTLPGEEYEITWWEVRRKWNGQTTRIPHKDRRRAPEDRVWYYPSVSGQALPTPAWPPGQCYYGGTESITYTDPSISLVSKAASSAPPDSGSVGTLSGEPGAGCVSCTGGGPGVPGINFATGLGQALGGTSAGAIFLSTAEPNLSLATRAPLQFSGATSTNTGVEVIANASGLLQVVAPQAFAVISSNTPIKYLIQIYRPGAIGAWDGTKYAVTNGATNLLTTWTLENPNAGDTNGTSLRITP